MARPDVRRVLTEAEWAAELAGFRYTAFHLETQPAYLIDDEQDWLARWLAGDMTPPTAEPAIRAWLDDKARQAAEGKRTERVRVFEDPPTDYQRWEQWFGRWNVEAGEHIRYMTRARAVEVGLLPDAAPGRTDWWLLDSSRLLVTYLDEVGRPGVKELVTDAESVVKACAWRDLATFHSAPVDYPELSRLGAQ